jgi:hypothetical protein
LFRQASIRLGLTFAPAHLHLSIDEAKIRRVAIAQLVHFGGTFGTFKLFNRADFNAEE